MWCAWFVCVFQSTAMGVGTVEDMVCVCVRARWRARVSKRGDAGVCVRVVCCVGVGCAVRPVAAKVCTYYAVCIHCDVGSRFVTLGCHSDVIVDKTNWAWRQRLRVPGSSFVSTRSHSTRIRDKSPYVVRKRTAPGAGGWDGRMGRIGRTDGTDGMEGWDGRAGRTDGMA